MTKKIFLLSLCAILSLIILAACNNTDDEMIEMPAVDENNPVQIFINENREELEEASAEHLGDLGPGATVDFLAGDGSFTYVYTFGPGPDADELFEYANALLEFPANIEMYKNLAGNLADLIELDSLYLTVTYYDGQGMYVVSRTFESR